MSTISIDKDSPVLALLDELATIFGNRGKALEAFVTTDPLFQKWRDKVTLCPFCSKWVIVKCRERERRVLDFHRIPNPDGKKMLPAYIPCPGTDQEVRPPSPTDEMRLGIQRAHIEHHIEVIRPGLL